MLSRAVISFAGTLTLGVLGAAGAACTGGDDEPPGLDDRLRAVLDADDEGTAAVVGRLAQLGVDVDAAELRRAPVTCPEVSEPEAGDRATCRLDLGGQRLEIDLQFEADETISVVGVAVAP